MERDVLTEERRMLAAIAAALLGSQGSPVWTRTAELLLLSSPDTKLQYHRARLELEKIMGTDVSRR